MVQYSDNKYVIERFIIKWKPLTIQYLKCVVAI